MGLLEKQLEQVISTIAGELGWMVVAAIAVLTFKNTIQRVVEGIMFFFGGDYKVDDIVYINGTKKVRITRQGLTKTTFYVYDSKRKLIIRNDKLPHLMLEKSLPQNGETDEYQ
jgi:hypothetical protein|tara:strand:+ start:150 stop:488 length:339 start_codon:yes stop_codon:yes gene_type:complete